MQRTCTKNIRRMEFHLVYEIGFPDSVDSCTFQEGNNRAVGERKYCDRKNVGKN